MSKKKKLFAGLMILALLAIPAFLGCDSEEAEEAEESEDTEAGEETEASFEDFPEHTVTLTVPWPPGGRTDTYARMMAPYLEEELGVAVTVANESGGGGTVGAASVANATPDGYNMLLMTQGMYFQQWTRVPPLDLDEFTPVCGHSIQAPHVLVVNRDQPWDNLDDFVQYAQDNPGDINLAVSGIGTTDHVYGSSFFLDYDLEVDHHPYEGDAPAVTATIGGEVDAMFAPFPAVEPSLDELRVLGVTSNERIEGHEDIKTFEEEGYDYAFEAFDAIYVPAETPDEVVNVLEAAFEVIVNDPELTEDWAGIEITSRYLSSAEQNELEEEWQPIWEETIEALGLREVD